jgi:hypothetical protein
MHYILIEKKRTSSLLQKQSHSITKLYGRFMMFQQYFSYMYIVAVSFIGGGNQSSRRKPPTCHKNYIAFLLILCLFVYFLSETDVNMFVFFIFISLPCNLVMRNKDIYNKYKTDLIIISLKIILFSPCYG